MCIHDTPDISPHGGDGEIHTRGSVAWGGEKEAKF